MRNDLGELAAFAVVAEERSFTRAAARLGVSQSALSHSMRGLEKRLGLQLLARTTRSVSPTAAGGALLAELAPALERIERSLAEARNRRKRPAGRIRLVIPRTAAYLVLLPKLAEFARMYPEIELEVTSSNDPVDVVAEEYDAGIQIGEFIQRDMIAVRVSENLRLAVVGAPEYFKAHGIPRSPHDLKDHSCIGFRFSSGVYRWEFEKGRKAFTVHPRGTGFVRRAGTGNPGCAAGHGDRHVARSNPGGHDCGGSTGAGAPRLVPGVSRIFFVLSQPAQSACGACCVDQHTSGEGAGRVSAKSEAEVLFI